MTYQNDDARTAVEPGSPGVASFASTKWEKVLHSDVNALRRSIEACRDKTFTIYHRAILGKFLSHVFIGPIPLATIEESKKRRRKVGPWCVWPTQTTIALSLNISRAKVAESLDELVERGLVERRRMPMVGSRHADHHRCEYVINPDAIKALGASEPEDDEVTSGLFGEIVHVADNQN